MRPPSPSPAARPGLAYVPFKELEPGGRRTEGTTSASWLAADARFSPSIEIRAHQMQAEVSCLAVPVCKVGVDDSISIK